jgi:hypothetical protein
MKQSLASASCCKFDQLLCNSSTKLDAIVVQMNSYLEKDSEVTLCM